MCWRNSKSDESLKSIFFPLYWNEALLYNKYYHLITKLQQTYHFIIISVIIDHHGENNYRKLLSILHTSYCLGIINHRTSISRPLTTFSSLKRRIGLADLFLGCFMIPKLSSCCIIIRVIKSFREINLAIQLEDSQRPWDILRSKLKAISRSAAGSDSTQIPTWIRTPR